MVHSPPYDDWDLTLSVGNTFAFEACIRSFLKRGDSIIMEEYGYTGAIYSCRYSDHMHGLNQCQATGNKFSWDRDG